jgi:hypothetical protein
MYAQVSAPAAAAAAVVFLLTLLLLLLLLAQVYVLADTSYNPLSVDEVAAAHVNADCVVSACLLHFHCRLL